MVLCILITLRVLCLHLAHSQSRTFALQGRRHSDGGCATAAPPGGAAGGLYVPEATQVGQTPRPTSPAALESRADQRLHRWAPGLREGRGKEVDAGEGVRRRGVYDRL